MDNLSVYNSKKFVEAYIKKEHKKFDKYKEFLFKHISVLPKGGSILDLGCGTGIAAYEMAKLGYKVLGTDYSEEFISYARRTYKLENLEYRFMDINAMNQEIKPNSFNCITSFNVMLHVPVDRLDAHLKTIKASLTEKGVVILMTKEADRTYEEIITDSKDKFGFEVTRTYTFVTKNFLLELLTNNGLEIVDIEQSEQGITGSGVSRQIKVAARKL